MAESAAEFSNKPPLKGVFVVSLYDIDNKWLDNYRSDASDDSLDQLRGSIEEASDKPTIGIKTTPLGAWNPEQTKIYLVAGFKRFEAASQIALRSLVKEYNEHHQLTPKDEGYLSYNGNTKDGRLSTIERQKMREKIRQLGGDWEKKYDEALKAWKLPVSVRYYGDTTTEAAKQLAMLDNIDENENRDQPSLSDKLNRLSLMRQSGMKDKDIAAALGLTPGQVSTFGKVQETPTILRELFKSDEMSKLYPKKDDLDRAVVNLETAVGELERRMKLDQENPQVVKFSHVRQFVYAVTSKKGSPIVLREVIKLLKDLVQLDDNWKPTEKATVDYGVFEAKIESAKKASQLPDTPPATEATAPPVTQVDADIEKTVMEAAEKAAAATAAATAPAAAPAATAPAAAPASTDAAVPTGKTDAEVEAEIKAANERDANLDVPPSDELSEGDEATFDDLVSNDDVASADVAAAAATAKTATAATTDGQTNRKTADVSAASKYKMLPPEQLEAFASEHLTINATDPTATVVDICTFAFAGTEIYHALGLTAEYGKANSVSVAFTDEVNKYVKALEEHAATTMTVEQKDALAKMKPIYKAPSFA